MYNHHDALNRIIMEMELGQSAMEQLDRVTLDINGTRSMLWHDLCRIMQREACKVVGQFQSLAQHQVDLIANTPPEFTCRYSARQQYFDGSNEGHYFVFSHDGKDFGFIAVRYGECPETEKLTCLIDHVQGIEFENSEDPSLELSELKRVLGANPLEAMTEYFLAQSIHMAANGWEIGLRRDNARNTHLPTAPLFSTILRNKFFHRSSEKIVFRDLLGSDCDESPDNNIEIHRLNPQRERVRKLLKPKLDT